MRLARVYALLAMAAMSLRLGRMYAQVVYIHGSSSHQENLHSATPISYRIARTCQPRTLIHGNVFRILCMEGMQNKVGGPAFSCCSFYCQRRHSRRLSHCMLQYASCIRQCCLLHHRSSLDLEEEDPVSG